MINMAYIIELNQKKLIIINILKVIVLSAISSITSPNTLAGKTAVTERITKQMMINMVYIIEFKKKKLIIIIQEI